jgi:hypothetical protein
MSPSLEETARAIAEQRRQEAKKLFETNYAEVVATLAYCQLTYQAAINRNGEVEIVFSKFGMPDLFFVMLPEGLLSSPKHQPMTPQELTTFLADYLASLTDNIVKEGKRAARISNYSDRSYEWLWLFLLTAAIFFFLCATRPEAHSVKEAVAKAVGLVTILEGLGLFIYLLARPTR